MSSKTSSPRSAPPHLRFSLTLDAARMRRARDVTAFYSVLDPRTAHLLHASAGHPAPIHCGPFGARPLAVTYGPPLGSFSAAYSTGQATLTLEDYLVLYTDGVTEGRHGRELYGESRLLDVLKAVNGLSAQEVAADVLSDVGTFADRLADDIQILAVRLA